MWAVSLDSRIVHDIYSTQSRNKTKGVVRMGRKGYTLIELMTVITMFGIVVAIVFPIVARAMGWH